ncbi:MAG: DUF1634 domain-containing protein [Candidatus Acidiferrales bacterium]
MNGAQHNSDEKHFDEMISLVLRTGVIVSSIVVLAGGILYLVQSGMLKPVYHPFHGEPANLRELRGIVRGVFTHSPRNWMQFGLLLLVATPVARVALCFITFMKEKDRAYIVLTLIVLCVLIFGLIGH